MGKKFRKHKPFSIAQILILLFSVVIILLLFFYSRMFGDNIYLFLASIVIFVVFSILIIFIVAIKMRIREEQLTKALEMADIDKMSGIEFEKYVGELLKSQGYKITFTPESNDYGVDIVAQKDDVRYAVQVKRYRGMVGVDAVNQAVAGKGFYACNRAMVVTNSFFTSQAFAQAKANYVKLINKKRLAEWIIDYQKNPVHMWTHMWSHNYPQF